MKGKGIISKLFKYFCLVIAVLAIIPIFMMSAQAGTNWWDKYGEPQYGGTAVIAVDGLGDNIDPYNYFGAIWEPFEQMFMADTTLDRDTWSFKVQTVPEIKGLLAKSWEWDGPQSLVVHLRQDVHWHNKQPTNGREFTADDVVFHYDRELGTGEFTKPNPVSRRFIDPVKSVEALDKYTVVVHFKDPTLLANWWAITDPTPANMMEPREMLEVDTKDWHNSAGTGAFMLTDFISGSSLTLSRNPDYYFFDERYPDKRLPYFDAVKQIVITDIATKMAALRSKKVDTAPNLGWQNAKSLQKSNPDIIISKSPLMGHTIDMRMDKKPFTDIRVRKALQLAVDIKTIAETHFGGYVSSDPPGLLAADYKGWTRPYKDWPKDLQEEYTFNPEKAKKLLAEAGYPDGFDTNCYAQTTDDLELIQIVKSQFADIGVNMEIRTLERSQFYPFIQAGKHDQMMVFFICNQTFPINICYNNRTSKGAPMNKIYAPAQEAAHYDKLFERFLASKDEDEAKKLGLQMEEYLYRQHWTVVTPGKVRFDAMQSRIKGFSGELIDRYFGGLWFWARYWMGEGTK